MSCQILSMIGILSYLINIKCLGQLLTNCKVSNCFIKIFSFCGCVRIRIFCNFSVSHFWPLLQFWELFSQKLSSWIIGKKLGTLHYSMLISIMVFGFLDIILTEIPLSENGFGWFAQFSFFCHFVIFAFFENQYFKSNSKYMVNTYVSYIYVCQWAKQFSWGSDYFIHYFCPPEYSILDCQN